MDDPAPPPPVLAYHAPRVVLPAAPVSKLTRFACLAAGVLLPALCLLLALAGVPVGPEWQSGRWADRVALLLQANVGWPFYPLLAYAMASMAMLVANPMRWVRRFPVRMGAYTGAVLALHYAVVMAVALAKPRESVSVETATALVGAVAATAGAVGSLWFLQWLGRRFGAGHVMMALTLIGVLAVVAGLAVSRGSPVVLIAVPIVVALAGSPAWSLAAYATMSWFAWRYGGVEAVGPASPQAAAGADPRQVALRAAGWVAWAAAYAVAWRQAAANAAVEYAKLPTSAPGCYVATAAARGHRPVVRSAPVRAASGAVFPANDQMRRLKCAELALRAIAPRAHRACRRAYDRVGPPLARRLTHPLLADAAYLALKPAEWAAAVGLRLLVRGGGAAARQLYRDGTE